MTRFILRLTLAAVAVAQEGRINEGAAILGVGGDEVDSILDFMYAKAPYTVIERAFHIHPTVSELIPAMLGTAALSQSSAREHLRDPRAGHLDSVLSNQNGRAVVAAVPSAIPHHNIRM